MLQQPQQPIRVSPDPGMSVASKAMDDAVTYYLEHGGPDVAKQQVLLIFNALKFYQDSEEAYAAGMERIAEAERQLQQEAEQRHLSMMMSMLGPIRQRQQEEEAAAAAEEEHEEEDLLAQLHTPEAERLWVRLQAVGIVDEQLQPIGLSRSDMTVVIDWLSQAIPIKHKWKTFEKLWNKRNLRMDFRRAYDRNATSPLIDRLKEAIPLKPNSCKKT